MNGADYRQQEELHQERMREELAHLVQLEKAGMHEVAEFFAADLGITKEFQQEIAANAA